MAIANVHELVIACERFIVVDCYHNSGVMAGIHVQGVQLQTLLKSGLQVCCVILPAAEDGHYC